MLKGFAPLSSFKEAGRVPVLSWAPPARLRLEPRLESSDAPVLSTGVWAGMPVTGATGCFPGG